MGGIGWHNPVPFEIGGGTTEDERIYEATKRAVGIGGYAVAETGIDALWRQCKAGVLSTLSSFPERAALQAFPNLATDHLPVYEAEFNLTPGAADTDVARRAAITTAYISDIASDIPDIRTQLQAIDPRADVLDTPRAKSTITALGKALQPQDGNPSYGGGRLATSWPNYATEHYVPVILATSSPVPTPADLLVIQRIKRFLRDVLPSWVDFAVMTSAGGFTLDLSPLDMTGMT